MRPECFRFRPPGPPHPKSDAALVNQINDHTWLVADITITRSFPSVPRPASCLAHWFDDTDQSSYTVTKTLEPPPTEFHKVDSPHVIISKTFHSYRFTWDFGNRAILRMERLHGPTPGAEVLEWVRAKEPRTFSVPDSLYLAMWENWCVSIIETPGRPFEDAWRHLSPIWRSRYIKAIADAIDEMATWTSNKVEGVKGKPLIQCLLCTVRSRNPHGHHHFDYDQIPATVEAMGLNTERTVFAHGNFSAANIWMEDKPETGKLWIMEWDCAGFYPLEFIRTQLSFSPQLAVIYEIFDYPDDLREVQVGTSLGPPLVIDAGPTRELLEELKARGYPECHIAYLELQGRWDEMEPFTEEMIRNGQRPAWW